MKPSPNVRVVPLPDFAPVVLGAMWRGKTSALLQAFLAEALCLNWLRKSLEERPQFGRMREVMPLIKLSRINKGGEIVVNSDHILFIEIESKTTTVHMTDSLLFSVEEPLDSIAIKTEAIETARIKNAIQQSGLTGKSS